MIEPIFYERAQDAINRGHCDPFDLVGFLPQFLDPENPNEAVDQLNDNYAHGGGWFDFEGFQFDYSDPSKPRLLYPGDPPTEAVAYWMLREETVILFDRGWVAVVQPNGNFRVSSFRWD